MIAKIDSIKNFGIYKNFSWGNMVEFKEKNIIYGWNYSGKTTLSRVFSSIRDNKIFSDYANGEFKLTTKGNGSFSKSNLTDFPFNLLVFNSDYVKENLKWELDSEINAIFFQVGEDAKNAKRIEDLQKLVTDINGDETIKGKKEPFLADVKSFESFDGTLFTIESKRIKNEVFSSLIEFNKGNFKKEIPFVLQNLNGFILNKTELSRLSKTVKIKEPKPVLDLIEFEFRINEIISEVNLLLVKEPSKSKLSAILENGNNSLEWIKKGLELNNSGEKCMFCDNLITEDRIQLLNKFYENESSKLRDSAKVLFEKLKLERENIQLNFPSSIQDINEGFQEQYTKKKESIDRRIKSYLRKLDSTIKHLSDKINKNLYKKVKEINEFNIDSITKDIKELNEVLKNNNTFTDEFQTLIKSERLKYINHLVAKFLKENKYASKKKKNDKALKQIKVLEEKVALYLKEIERLKALKNSGEEGCQQFNFFIKSFLGKEDFEIKYDKIKGKFSLLRGNEIARNFSEGEKMAISFSHFMVTLSSIKKEGKLKDLIVFIDDPMSSLDGNHIFQINALIKDFFYAQGLDSQNPEKWVQKCKQLFISTHNFEFFNLLKETPTSKGFRYSSKGTKGDECRYFISRKVNESIIEKLPKVYDTYKSEYHYLFKEIHMFKNDPNNTSSDNILLMPNILRRFLEMYTLTKYPTQDEVDKRADKIFGKRMSKRICKPFHHFSHFNNIDRIGKQSELLADVNSACRELVDYIENKDKMHFSALKSIL